MLQRKLFLSCILCLGCTSFLLAQDENTEAETDVQEETAPSLSVEGSLVDFPRDVWPILESKCLSCHGPDDAKNDFRVDDSETMLSYIEAGDIENTFLWTDYLVTDDPDLRMPPPNTATGDLTGSELATLRLWIEEGATWTDPVADESAEAETVAEDVTARPLAERLLSFQGLFHPASVHFPIALLSISGLFVFLSFFNRDSCEPVAFHCLWIGALGAVASCVMGWGYAEHEGYGAYSFDIENSAIDRHRWLGIAVAAIAIVLVPMAKSVRKKGDMGMRVIWFLGSLFLVAAVGTAGYQGGELTYGEDHYGQEFQRMFPEWVSTEDGSADDGATDTEGSEVSEEASEESTDSENTELENTEPENTAAESPEELSDGDDEASSADEATEESDSGSEEASSDADSDAGA